MLWMILIGFVIGLVAKFLMPGRDPGGFIVTTILGIAGSAFAGWLGAQVGLYSQGESVGFIASVVGAMLILVLYRALLGRKT
jgi:uncharacterized membrane protein YeaQ/YmgE (transglycosylase-associated protein family)